MLLSRSHGVEMRGKSRFPYACHEGMRGAAVQLLSSTHPYPRYWVLVSCQLQALAALHPRKDPLYPLHRSLGGPRAGLDIFEETSITSGSIRTPYRLL
jgi:hypothetical protein